MKKIIAVSGFLFLGVIALSSCRKDYVCIVDGQVVDQCTNCRSNGLVKAAFDSSCSLDGGTVQVK